MKNVVKYCIIFFIICVSLLSIFLLKTVEYSKIWNGYSVFYVDKSVDLNVVLADINQDGIVYLGTQSYPKENELTPIMFDFQVSNFSSEEIRKIFYVDKNNRYQLFYVENSLVESVIEELRKKEITFGNDFTKSTPIICPIVCFVLIFILSILSKSKLKFFFAKLPFVLFAYSVPFYSVAISICCFVFFLFLAEIYFVRENFHKYIFKKTFLVIFAILCLTLFVISGLRVILLLLLSLIASYCILFVSSVFAKKNIYNFNMKQILPMKYISAKSRLNIKYVIFGFLSVFVLFVSFLVSLKFSNNIAEKNLFLPGPSEYNGEVCFSSLEENYLYLTKDKDVDSLPNIFDFVEEEWVISTFPYKVLSNETSCTISLGDVVSVPEYKLNSLGIVEESEKILKVFDEKYLLKNIESYKSYSGI